MKEAPVVSIAPRMWSIDIKAESNGSDVSISLKDEYFKGYREQYMERSFNSGPVNVTKQVYTFFDEKDAWMGTIVFTESFKAVPDLKYEIPNGPSKGQRVYHYFSGELQRSIVEVSLPPRHPKF